MKMKQKNILFVAALAAVGAMSTACMNDTDIESASLPTGKNIVMLTGTVSAKIGAATRSVDANGKTAWVEGEKIAVYYMQGGNGVIVEATVGTPNADGSAPITAELTDPQPCTVKLVYPASLANNDGEIEKSKLFNGQKGTIEDISKNWDAATGEVAITVNGNVATFTNNNLTLTNQVCICKFTLKDDKGSDVSTSLLKINDGKNNYTVTPASATNELTVAMLPIASQPFTFTATVGDDVYEKSGGTVALVKGNIYNSSISLQLKQSELSSSSPDGTIGTYKGREAIVATINGEKYAIATENLATPDATLTDSETGNAYYTFDDANDQSKTGLSSKATEWHVPTNAELENFCEDYAKGGTLDSTGLTVTIGTEPNNTIFFLAGGLTTNGAEGLENPLNGGYYWSSDKKDDYSAYYFYFDERGDYWTGMYYTYLTHGQFVRPFCKLE